MVAIGIVPKSKDQLGCEAAGVVTRVGPAVTHVKEGDRVFAVYNGLFATHKAIPGRCVAKMPETLSFEEAVTMPIVYLTVIYAVITLGQLRKGQVRILILLTDERVCLWLIVAVNLDPFRDRRCWTGCHQYLPNDRRRCKCEPTSLLSSQHLELPHQIEVPSR